MTRRPQHEYTEVVRARYPEADRLAKGRIFELPVGQRPKGWPPAGPHRGHQVAISKLNSSGLFAGKRLRAPI